MKLMIPPKIPFLIEKIRWFFDWRKTTLPRTQYALVPVRPTRPGADFLRYLEFRKKQK